MNSVDIMIPTYKPGNDFRALMHKLSNQSLLPAKIIIVNTEKIYWDRAGLDDFISGLKSVSSGTEIIVKHIKKSEFDHGGTRNMGIGLGNSKYFICMTEDAVPVNANLIKNMLEGFGNNVGLVYARQIPRSDAGEIERFTRRYNYPKKSHTKEISDKNRFGIKIYFASNVCAAYDREIFESLGGFEEGQILNEDMIFAHALLKSGRAVRYESGAAVYHSHEYSGLRQFQRNFDLAVSQTDNPEIFADLKSEDEGIKLVKKTAGHLIKTGKAYLLPRLVYISGCKYLGFRMGRMYRALPRALVRLLSMNRDYWR